MVSGLIGLLVVLPLAYCSLPLTQVATLTVKVSDQSGRAIKADVEAIYLDAEGREIQRITPRTRGSWDNNLHWWSHSGHDSSLLRPRDARRSHTVRIEAKGCQPASLPVTLERTYEPLSFSPHGGGPAYLIDRFERAVVLRCP